MIGVQIIDNTQACFKTKQNIRRLAVLAGLLGDPDEAIVRIFSHDWEALTEHEATQVIACLISCLEAGRCNLNGH